MANVHLLGNHSAAAAQPPLLPPPAIGARIERIWRGALVWIVRGADIIGTITAAVTVLSTTYALILLNPLLCEIFEAYLGFGMFFLGLAVYRVFTRVIAPYLLNTIISDTLRPDPNSPFRGMLEALFQIKGRPAGEIALTRRDKGSFSYDRALNALQSHAPQLNKLQYTYKMILALQELYKEGNLAIIAALDNRKSFMNNPASQFIFKLTGLITHFDEAPSSKIKYVCELYLSTFTAAKAEGRLEDFFDHAFNEMNTCFEGRSAHLENYASPDEFIEQLPKNIQLPARILEHYRVFRNKKARDCGDIAFIDRVKRGTCAAREKNNFYQKHCTQEAFFEYVTDYYKDLPQDDPLRPEIALCASGDAVQMFDASFIY